MEKVLLLLRIRGQDPSALARQVYEEGKARGWPGLGEEVAKICGEIGIPDANHVMVSKTQLKSAIWEHHDMDMKEQLNHSTELSDIKNDDFSKMQD